MSNQIKTTRRVAVAGALAALGIGARPVLAQTPNVSPSWGRGKKVLVLGAGVAGVCTAYELQRKGFDVTILEAADRAGGRSFTLRNGDSFQEMSGPRQHCNFTDGQWLNLGPGRLSHTHVNVLDYCREFGVRLEPYIFASRANLTGKGKQPADPRADNTRGPFPNGRLNNDIRGHVAALLDQCSVRGGLDPSIGAEDVKLLRQMLMQFGGLTPSGDAAKPSVYTNAEGHAGWEVPPGLVRNIPKPLSPLELDYILKSQVWNDSIFRELEFDWQASLMQPVGGMDMIWRGFLRQKLIGRPGTLKDLVRLNAPVVGLQIETNGVTVAWRDRGALKSTKADYCVSTIPMPIFRELKTNLDEPVKKAARELVTSAAGKVGWQAERFWERQYQIYGGISWVDGLTDQVWYPSDGFMSRRGTLTGAYMNADNAEKFNAQPIEKRLEQSRAAIERLHPGSGHLLDNGVAIGWNNMEHLRMGWADETHATFGKNAGILAQAQGGRLFQAGCQLTWHSGWQEGAILTAKDAVAQIVAATKPA